MKFNLGFFVREAFKNLRLNLLMSVTAITTTAICILILGTAMMINAHVEGVIRKVEQDVAITAFFPEDTTEEKIEEVRSSVEGYPEIKESTYVSKEEALRRFEEIMADQPDIVEGIGSDVLPASIEIQLKSARESEAVAEKLRNEGFTELSYPQQTVENINQFTNYVIWGLRGATIVFFVASVLLIFNTIRLSIFARRKEIEIMKLVGATDDFVRTPFVFEGLAQGLIGAGFAALLVVWTNALFVDWAHETIPFIPISSSTVNMLVVLLVLISVGVIIGIVGSYLSVRRFLKV
jgi:cell division transport system permease protein